MNNLVNATNEVQGVKVVLLIEYVTQIVLKLAVPQRERYTREYEC